MILRYLKDCPVLGDQLFVMLPEGKMTQQVEKLEAGDQLNRHMKIVMDGIVKSWSCYCKAASSSPP